MTEGGYSCTEGSGELRVAAFELTGWDEVRTSGAEESDVKYSESSSRPPRAIPLLVPTHSHFSRGGDFHPPPHKASLIRVWHAFSRPRATLSPEDNVQRQFVQEGTKKTKTLSIFHPVCISRIASPNLERFPDGRVFIFRLKIPAP